MSSNELNNILDDIGSDKHDEKDLAALRRLLSSSDRQSLLQLGKYSVNVGEGQDIQIGDRIYKGADAETIRKIIQDELQAVKFGHNSQSVRSGLYALTELMAVPQVRAAVFAFRTDFQAVCEQIDVLVNYKDLHDLLHTLEFQCYGGIVQEAKRFPDDETALDILMDHQLTLQQIVTDIQEIALRGTLAKNELLWLKDLVQATEELHGGIENLDTRQIKRAVWLINRVLAIQPSRINTSLNIAARVLRLPALVKALTCVRDNLTHCELDADKASQFNDGVEALASLEHSLTILVHSHNDWQELDLELRRIEANIEQDIFELELSWPDLKAMAESLYSSSIDEWALMFQQDSENLDSAIASKNPVKVKRYFRSYRRRAGDRFFRVDMDLKRLCGNLRIVGEPLVSVLRLIE
ncbi:hypothetical protein H6G80_34320 [Nostoc sp. FACHB-87]|uniref:hypothetical protein n=1 Tax=Nostocaceae TaxID=1162 RepID=UPI001689A42C|nr:MULTISPECIES: hypothetical protein [Nostocaceae]MBD2459112.1 hypothetical protein [Nostoc sp. FACHB-87]MBD2479731.1 hypothetical protein [Anabaena sp. FACHB-83]